MKVTMLIFLGVAGLLPACAGTASLGTWGVGALFRSPGVRETGMMMVESMLMVGLMQQPLRVIVGRAG